MAEVPDVHVELAQKIASVVTEIPDLRPFAYKHPAVGAGQSNIVMVQPAGIIEHSPDRAGRSIEIKRVVASGFDEQEAMKNAVIIFSKLFGNQLRLPSFRVSLDVMDAPSWFRQENDVHFANMRFKVFVAQTAGL